MTTTAIRSKLHKYIDEADNDVLEVVMKLLEVYRKGNTSLLTAEQKEEVFKRVVLYKEGKMKGASLPEVRKRVKQKLSAKYAGKLPDNISEELQNYASQSGKEWDDISI